AVTDNKYTPGKCPLSLGPGEVIRYPGDLLIAIGLLFIRLSFQYKLRKCCFQVVASPALEPEPRIVKQIRLGGQQFTGTRNHDHDWRRSEVSGLQFIQP